MDSKNTIYQIWADQMSIQASAAYHHARNKYPTKLENQILCKI